MWTCPDGARLLRRVAPRCRAPKVMFHKNKRGSMIRSTGTVFYSLLYLISRQGFTGLKYVYWLISVIDNSTRWGRLWDHIIPTNNILPAHHVWAGSLRFPPRAGCFFHGRQVRPEKSEATRPIPWYQPRTGCAPLRSRCRSLWARRWRIVAIISLHCLSEIGTLAQNRYWFWWRKLAQLLYLVVTPFFPLL